MLKSQWAKCALSILAASAPTLLFALKAGPDPGYAGAPGDGHPFSCASAGCHTAFINSGGGPINSYGGSVTATFSQGSSYTPGTPITITVKVSDPVNTTYGFQMTARLESNGQAGTFKPVSGVTGVVCENEKPRSLNGSCPTAAPLEFVEHTTPATEAWTFNWIPPADASAGNIHFYLAGNAVNGNGEKDAGDHVYTTEYVLTPIGACVESTPNIAAVISAGGFGARPDFASGTWLEIYGSNFSTVAKEWAGADFNGLAAPAVLDRVRVKVNGKDAFTRYVSPGQVNVQAPDNDGTGPMTVTVTNCESVSAPKSLSQLPAAPGMLVSGQNLLAFTPNGLRPAKPGEMIVAYGIGFGNTTPAVPAGTIANVLTSLSDPLVVTIGGVQLPSASIVYAGYAPGFVGLYQFNLIVPNVPDGDQPVTMRVGTATVNQTMLLSVKR